MTTTARLAREQKQDILKNVFSFIYSKAEERSKNLLEAIITKNTAIIGSGDLFLFYKGEHHSCRNAKRTVRKTNPLVPALKPFMEEWLDGREALKSESSLVTSFLAAGLNLSNNVTDYPRIFPDCLHPALQPFLSHPNHSEPVSDASIRAFQESNHRAISLIKQRLMLNVID